ncbi:MAG: ParM/StbA family protein [Halothiobacillus sp.]|nr:ParM/StbA family protein [Halothiobacillus sp.]
MAGSKISNTATVVVDDGFAHTKVAWMDPATKKIMTTSIPSLATAGLVATGFDGDVQGGYETDGLSFTVGGHLSNPHDTRDNSYPYSPINRCIVTHALRSAGFGRDEDVTVRLGLTIPMKPFFDLGRDYVTEKRRESYRKSVKTLGAKASINIDVDKLIVLPEAASAWVDFMLDDDGGDAADIEQSVAVFDVGGRTTDTAIFRNGVVDKAASGTDFIGVMDLIELIKDETRRIHKAEVSIQMAERALRDPDHHVSLWGSDIDITEIVHQAKRRVSESLYQMAMRRIGDGASFDVLLFVGGGAAVLGEALSEYPNVQVPHEPEFANARGALKKMIHQS